MYPTVLSSPTTWQFKMKQLLLHVTPWKTDMEAITSPFLKAKNIFHPPPFLGVPCYFFTCFEGGLPENHEKKPFGQPPLAPRMSCFIINLQDAENSSYLSDATKNLHLWAFEQKKQKDGVHGTIVSIWVFPKMVVPPIHTPKWSFLVGKPIVVGETHHFRTPPYLPIHQWIILIVN